MSRTALLGVLCFVIGCGGKVGAGDGGDATTAWSPVCPESVPAQGSACTNEGLECEYDCDVLECAAGTWAGAVLVGGNLCDAGPSSPSCPATISGIIPSASCTNSGETCVYAEGICQCNSPGDPTPDGGSSWFCGPEQGCPMPRPRIGSACSTPDQRCDYEECGANQVCTGGVWQPAIGACGA